MAGLYSPEGFGGSTYAALQGLYWLAVRLLAERPLTLVVDDAELCDEQSMRWLDFLVHRVDRLPLLVLATRRTGRTGPGADGLRCLAAAPRSTVHDLLPLSPPVVARIDGQREHVVEVARASAVLGTRNLDLVPELSGLPQQEVEDAVRVLRELGLTTGASVELGDDVIRSAVLSTLTPAECALRRSRAARLLYEMGRSVEDVSVQLLNAPGRGERWMTGVLRAAAGLAMERDEPETALRYLRRALDGDAGEDRMALLLDSVAPLCRTDPVEALSVVHTVLDEVTDPLSRARLGVEAAGLCMRTGQTAESVPLIAETLERLRENEPEAAQPELLKSLESWLLLASALERPTVTFAAQHARGRALPAGNTDSERTLLAGMAVLSLTQEKPAEEAADLARRALDDLGAVGFTRLCAGTVLLAADATDEAHQALSDLVDSSRRADPWMYLQGLATRALLRHRIGDLPRAVVDADTAERFRHGTSLQSCVDVVRALVLLERGELDKAEAALGRFDPSTAERFVFVTSVYLEAKGRIRWARGDLLGALDCFERGVRGTGGTDGTGSEALKWLPLIMEVRTELGERSHAAGLAEQALAKAAHWGTSRARGIALRAAGIARGGVRGMELLEQAADTLATSPARLELARTEIALARALLERDDKEGARKYSRRALNLGMSCEATTLASEAKSLLKAAGGRARQAPVTMLAGMRTEILTATECRVAELAVLGRRNSEIAEILFVSRRTVEFHLRNIYRKLNIADRKDLAARVHAASTVENP